LGLTVLSGSGGVAPSSLLEPDHAGSMTALGWSSYQTVAEQIAREVMSDPALRSNFLLCDEAVPGCLSDTIVEFGRRAFRRPLTDTEIALFETLVASGPETTPTGAPSEVAELLLYGFLVSPVFLVRSELHQDVVGCDVHERGLSTVGAGLLGTHVSNRCPEIAVDSIRGSRSREPVDADAPRARTMEVECTLRSTSEIRSPSSSPCFDSRLRSSSLCSRPRLART
jgi:hypothetical protein